MEIAELYSREKESDALQQLPADFYQRVHDLIVRLQRDRGNADNYRRQEYLDDQLKSIRICLDSLQEVRMGKVFTYSLTTAPPSNNMTPGERMLYEQLQRAIHAYKAETSKYTNPQWRSTGRAWHEIEPSGT